MSHLDGGAATGGEVVDASRPAMPLRFGSPAAQ